MNLHRFQLLKPLLFVFSLSCLFLILAVVLNGIAIQTNGGKMPVNANFHSDYSGDRHFFYIDEDSVNFPYLTDIFYYQHNGRLHVYSIGDVFFWGYEVLGFSTIILFIGFLVEIFLWRDV